MKHDVEMTFGEHIEELRRRVIAALIGIIVAAAVCGIFYKEVVSALLRPYLEASEQIQAQMREELGGTKKPKPAPTPPAETPAATPPAEGSETLAQLRADVAALRKELAQLRARLEGTKTDESGESPLAPFAKGLPPRIMLGNPLSGYLTILILCVIGGVFLSSPWVIYQFWAFVGIGLHAHERRFVRIYGPASFLLFIAGAALFYFYVLPLGLSALLSPTASIVIKGVPLIDPSLLLDDYFKFVAWMTLVFGVAFQTPLVVLFLARTGLIPLETMAKQQKYVILIMVVLGAVLTPTGDPISLALMTVPLIGLYQVGLLLAWLAQRKERREHPDRFEPYDDLKDS